MASHTEQEVHSGHDCWIPIFVDWAEGRQEVLDFGGRWVPERLQRLLEGQRPA